MTTSNTYEEAWNEGEEASPLSDAVARSKLEAKAALADEYIRAHQDLEDAEAAGDSPEDSADADDADTAAQDAADEAAADEDKKGKSA